MMLVYIALGALAGTWPGTQLTAPPWVCTPIIVWKSHKCWSVLLLATCFIYYFTDVSQGRQSCVCSTPGPL